MFLRAHAIHWADPLIGEAKQRMWRRRLLVALAAVVAATGVAVGSYALVARPAGGSLPAPRIAAPPTSAEYSLVAAVLHISGKGRHLNEACWIWSDSLPSAGCGGVTVTGFDFGHIHRVTRWGTSEWQTSVLRLTGRWNGKVFSVMSASPAKLSEQTIPAQPNCLAHRSGPVVRPSQGEITQASEQVNLLQSGPCGHSYYFLAAVADHRTVAYLHRRFGESILVGGWLKPRHR
jgi:hypothetical protein